MNDIDKANALQEKAAEYRRKVASGEIQILSPRQKSRNKPKSLRLAINAKCFDCTCDQKREVTMCVMTDCSLWSLRPWQRDEINRQILSGEIK